MKVKRLKMQSFRGIGDLTLEFDQMEPTVLIGINGVGKSSILDCLAILLSQLTGQVKGSVDAIRFFSEQDINNEGNRTHNEITILMDTLQEESWFLTKVREEVSKNIKQELGSVQVNILSILESFNQKNAQGTSRVTENLQKASDILKNLIGSILTDIKIAENSKPAVEYIRHLLETNIEASIPLGVYYPVNRAVLEMPLEISEEYLFKQIDAYDQALMGGKIDFKAFFEWFRNREDLENQKRRDNPDYRDKQLEAVRQAISSLIPEFANLRVERSPLRMTVRKQGEELIVNQLSDGEKCLLAMVGDLARRLAIANPGLPDPLQGSGVVLIDEIELHLHPKWQREIIPALTRTFPNCQFIVTTHSPQVISQVKPEGIYILEKTDEGVVAKRPESSFGRDSNRILEDLMGVPSRPQEIKDRLHELFRLIDEGNLDGARQLSQEIADIIGQDEPELVKASVSIRRKEILKR